MLPIQENISLASLTTYKIGGPARYFVKIDSKEDLEEALTWSKKHDLPYFILGSGSNLLIADQGFAGLVIKIANKQLTLEGDNIIAAAGECLANLVGFATEHALTGLEWATSIPGTVGGAVRGNAGAYGGEMSQKITKVEVFDLDSNQWKEFGTDDCTFAYRDSVFKQNKKLIIWSIVFNLTLDRKNDIQGRVKEIIIQRNAKVPSEPSCGCVFQNILINDLPASAQPLLEKYTHKIVGTKFPTAVLLEDLGIKGMNCGGATSSQLHANFFVNQSHAKAQDVIDLIKKTKELSLSKYGFAPEVEVEMVGF